MGLLNNVTEMIECSSNDQEVADIMQKYQEIKLNGLNGELGETAQFWLTSTELISQLHLLHFAINTNNLTLKIKTWEKLLPFCFVTNKIHYARYATFYIQQLKSLEESHPGAIQEIKVCIRQKKLDWYWTSNRCSLGTDVHEECKNNRWHNRVLTRPFQTRFLEALFQLGGKSRTMSDPRKCLRYSEIRRSNEMVGKVMDVIVTQFINPFDESLDSDKLYSLVSGGAVNESISDSLLSAQKNGQELMKDFINRITVKENKDKFSDTIKRFRLKTIQDSFVKAKVSKNGKEGEVRVQRDILCKLVSLSNSNKSAIDLEAALNFPLAPVCLPLSNCDGTIRKTVKSKLYQAAMSDLTIVNPDDLPPPSELYTYFLDLAASIRVHLKGCETIRQLAWKLLSSIPCQYKTVYIACDTYRTNSIKSGERKLRGSGKRYVLKSPDMKMPFDMNTFLGNGKNKEMLFNLIECSIKEDRHRLKERVVFFSNSEHCSKITSEGSCLVPEKASDHEEADTKLVALVNSADVNAGESLGC